jgi:hypothetical protein
MKPPLRKFRNGRATSPEETAPLCGIAESYMEPTKGCSMEELRREQEKWNKYGGKKVELGAEPRTLVPPGRENPESYHSSVVTAFKTKDELIYFMKQQLHANYLVYTVRRFR